MSDPKKILVIATSYGVETDELIKPKEYLEENGHRVTVATPENESIQTLVMDYDSGARVPSDALLSESQADDFDILIVPGGTINADALRQDDHAQRLVKAFAAAGKPIAAICHAPWLIVEADLVVGKTLTSFLSLRTDVNNAGGAWVDKPVVVDDTNGFILITSRTPKDMEQFTAAISGQLD